MKTKPPFFASFASTKRVYSLACKYILFTRAVHRHWTPTQHLVKRYFPHFPSHRRRRIRQRQRLRQWSDKQLQAKQRCRISSFVSIIFLAHILVNRSTLQLEAAEKTPRYKASACHLDAKRILCAKKFSSGGTVGRSGAFNERCG